MDVLIEQPFYSGLFVGLGMVFFLLEVFIPSFGILGLFAIGFVTLGIYGFFEQGHEGLGFGALFLAVAFAVVVLVYVLRRLRLSSTLSPETCNSIDEAIPGLEGKEGVSLTTLRPAGLARIDGKRVDVVAKGKFIEKDRKVRVVETSGNRVVVLELSTSQPAETEHVSRQDD